MTPVQVAAAWTLSEYTWPWSVGMRVLNLGTLPTCVNDPMFNELVRQDLREVLPSDIDPENLTTEIWSRVQAFPKRDEDLLYEEGEEWRVSETGVLPEGLFFFSVTRVIDEATVTFARMGRDYFYGEIKFDGVEQWFVGKTGPMPIPDLCDAETRRLLVQPVGPPP